MSINAFNPEPNMRENKFTVSPGERWVIRKIFGYQSSFFLSRILRCDKSISFSFKNQTHACKDMKGTKKGRIFCTNWRVSFL